MNPQNMELGASQMALFEERLREVEQKCTALQAENAALRAENAALRDQNAQLQQRCIALEAENKLLREKVVELEERLGRNSRNSNQPPSSDVPGQGTKDGSKQSKQRRRQKGKKRKRGGQPGHRGSHRALVPADQVDHVEDHFPRECECCGEGLPETPSENPERFQITELPPVVPEITEHRGHQVECPSCGHHNRGHIPAQVKSSAFGARLTSIVVMLTGGLHLSRRQAKEALKSFFNVTISVGAMSAIESRFAKLVKPVIEQAWQQARAARVKHADGTSWLQTGSLLQIWTIATSAVTVFKILSDGTARTLRTLFANSGGILVSDRATALNFWAMKKRQICWAHLLRKFISFSERDGPAGAFGRELLDYTGIMFDYYWAHKEGRLSSQVFEKRMAPLREQFEALLRRVVAAKIKGISGACQDILGHREALWTFVADSEVDPTNNHAERELRRFVLWRRRSFGSRSEAGNLFAERMMTVVHTARKQGKPLLPFLTEVCEAHRDSRPLPSLVG